jgi:hypothetical protein
VIKYTIVYIVVVAVLASLIVLRECKVALYRSLLLIFFVSCSIQGSDQV